MNSKHNTKDTIVKVLRWIASVYLIVAVALGLSTCSFVSAICFLVVLFLVIPIRIDFMDEIKNKVYLQKSVQIILCVILLITGALTMKLDEISSTTANVSTSMKSSIPRETVVPTETTEPVIDVSEYVGSWKAKYYVKDFKIQDIGTNNVGFVINHEGTLLFYVDERKGTFPYKAQMNGDETVIHTTSSIDIVFSNGVGMVNDGDGITFLFEKESSNEELVVPTAIPSSFSIQYLDVGQGDSALVECDGHYMLIDGGLPKESSKIYSILKKNNIQALDCIVASHAHADHIGGLSGALNYASVGTVLCSTDTYDTEEFESFKKYAEEKSTGITIPKEKDQYTLGSATIDILAVNYGEEDNSSIVLLITYGKNKFLFTGDMDSAEEGYLCDTYQDELNVDVLKVAHHGSNTSSSYRFIRMLMPKYAMISVGKDNSYGHPNEEVLSRLKDADTEIYRTDLNGTITVTSDGENITITTEKEATAEEKMIPGSTPTPVPTATSSPTPTPSPTSTSAAKEAVAIAAGTVINATIATEAPIQEETKYSYTVNTNTKKFHRPNCSSAKKIKSSNRWDYEGARDELINMGYNPCQRCNP